MEAKLAKAVEVFWFEANKFIFEVKTQGKALKGD
jgi:hypothetical protein